MGSVAKKILFKNKTLNTWQKEIECTTYSTS